MPSNATGAHTSRFYAAFCGGNDGNRFAKLLTRVPAPSQTLRIGAIKHMFSARQQKMPDGLPPDESLASPSGFGKVLSSLQGLQQRLDEFSVEEVSRAHSRAIELIQQLSNLDGRLGSLKKLHQDFTSAGTAVAAIPAIDFCLLDSDDDGLKNHPRLRAILKAGELLHKLRPLLAEQRINLHQWPPSEARKTDTASAITDISLDTRSVARSPDQTFPTTEPLPGIPPVFATAAIPESIPGPTGFTLVGEPREREPNADSYDFAALKLDDRPGNEPASPSRKTNEPANEPNLTAVGAFDERLLRDLIDSYGEFAATKEHTVGEPSTALQPVSQRAQTSISKPVEKSAEQETAIEKTASSPESDKITAGVLLPPEPKFLGQKTDELLALPTPETDESVRDFDQPVANLKSRGEIDQQLKSIIRDYGKVDLYSHESSGNARNKMIAAAVLLALVLSGLYFFSASSSPQPTKKEASAFTEPVSPPEKDAKNPSRQN